VTGHMTALSVIGRRDEEGLKGTAAWEIHVSGPLTSTNTFSYFKGASEAVTMDLLFSYLQII